MLWQTGTPKHKVFISYHHHGDGTYKDDLLRRYSDAFVDYSVRTGEIDDSLPTERIRQQIRDEFIRDATVTIVLIGRNTWKRKYVDWEIDSSLRNTTYNPRNGVVGLLLPTYQTLPDSVQTLVFARTGKSLSRPQQTPEGNWYTPNNIPPRLWDNVLGPSRFAQIHSWPSNPDLLRRWIHEAFVRRDKTPWPTLARSTYSHNRPDDQDFWID